MVTGGSLWEVLLEIRKSETPLRTVEDNGERLDYMDIAKIMPQDSLSPRNKNNSPIISAIILQKQTVRRQEWALLQSFPELFQFPNRGEAESEKRFTWRENPPFSGHP